MTGEDVSITPPLAQAESCRDRDGSETNLMEEASLAITNRYTILF